MSGKTPLMWASQYGAVASMTKLMKLNCNPDLLDSVGCPALLYAIHSEVLPAIHMLLPYTTQGLEPCITDLARATAIPMSEQIKMFIKEKTEDSSSKSKVETSSDLILSCFEESVKFGNVEILKLLVGRNQENDAILLLNDKNKVKKKLKQMMPTLIQNSIYSDNFKVCEIVRDLCLHLDYEIENRFKEMAKERGIRKIIEAYVENTSWDDDLKIKLKNDVTNHIGPLNYDSPILLDIIPKSREFPYYDELAKIKKMLPKSINNETKLITFNDIIKKLWVPAVHYQEHKCPKDCSQKDKCLCIREVLILLKHLIKEISKQFSIFSGTYKTSL